jgi:signal peptidase I
VPYPRPARHLQVERGEAIRFRKSARLEKFTLAKKDDNTESAEEQKPQETPVEFLSSLAAVLVTGLFIITFVMQAFEIPSSSMENTLLIGDHVFVNRIQFAPKSSWLGPLLPYRDIRRGDIVVFLHPDPSQAGTYVVKRIMGIPGDRIHLRNAVVYRNGEELKEPYSRHQDPFIPSSYRDDFPAVPPSESYNVAPYWEQDLPTHIQDGDLVVPPDHYFAMGDNRDVSLDSRYWGFIPKENVIGRPMFIYWSFETPDRQYLKTAWSDRLLFLGKVVIHFFDETRWRRTLQVVR